MFSEANAAIRAISPQGTEVFLVVNSPHPEELQKEFQKLLDEQR